MALASPLAVASGDLGVALAAIVVVGTAAQWVASRARAPSVLVLLVAGVVAGPEVAGLVDPDEVLGDLLFPVISLAVGVLLFEGGLHLRFRELERQGALPVVRLVTVGALVTWLVLALVGRWVLGLGTTASTLLGAVLIVSGPTVMIPLLRYARVREPVNGVLRWEGILIDPIGATVAVVVLGAVVDGGGPRDAAEGVASTAGAGVVAGLVGAALLTLALHRHWAPDELHNAVTLATVVAVFAGADLLRPEAGLFAATVMGVALANQRVVSVSHIQEFQGDLGTLILSGLFVLLGARVDLGEALAWAPEALVMLAALVLVARPLAVWASTVGSGLTARERAYLACMAPRGIVAASVAAVFALELDGVGRPVDALVPVTYMVIVGTVVAYGLAARPMARWLHVAQPEPAGVVLIGGPPWALELGSALADRDVTVLVVTRDRREAAAAATRGLLSYTRRLDADELGLAFDSVGARLAIAASRAPELNAYGLRRAIAALGRANVYYLPRHRGHGRGEADAVSRRPFGPRVTQAGIADVLAAGGRIVSVTGSGSPGRSGTAGAAPGRSGTAGAAPGGDAPGGDARTPGPGGPGGLEGAGGSRGSGGSAEQVEVTADGAPTDATPVPVPVPEGAVTLMTVTAAGIPVVASDEPAGHPPRGATRIYLVPPPGSRIDGRRRDRAAGSRRGHGRSARFRRWWRGLGRARSVARASPAR